ncbi:MAG: DUF4942 domain-containing protein [Candidatus Sedimenticola sp. (ex Thyasira tokunagai)]
MIDHQFYPTPSKLAYKAKRLFKKPVSKMLEPSAGRGDLLEPWKGSSHSSRIIDADCIEADLENQAILREKGYKVIDSDFLQFEGGAMYSHIVMNPPFNRGIDHVLKAWDILYSGEIVAILNEASVGKIGDTKSALLGRLIEEHGSVEFIDDAFVQPDAQRKTKVRVALIYLSKEGESIADVIGTMKADDADNTVHLSTNTEIGFHNNNIKSTVRAFRAAVASMKEAITAGAKADQYSGMIGMHLDIHGAPSGSKPFITGSYQGRLNERYAELKKAAWNHILSATEFSKHLSSKAYNRLYSDFELVSQMEFTEANIHGFLAGLIAKKGDMNAEMVQDVFDEISKYHIDNRVYYRGWKSNSKHRKGSYRIRMTRFILPGMADSYSWSNKLTWDSEKKLADFDKTFAMLDGKQRPEISIVSLFKDRIEDLASGARLQSSYFDIRYYPGVGTIHFFPRNKSLIDRMNRVVGRMRKWLPDEDTASDPVFWNQYEQAEKVTAEMMKNNKLSRWDLNYGQVDIGQMHTDACERLDIKLPMIGSGVAA